MPWALAPTRVQGSAKDMGKSIPRYLGQLDIRKSVVGLATGAGAIYLLYKAIKAGLKCQAPLCSNSPICIARECPVPGERALPQEAPASEASPVGRPKGDSFKFLSPSSFSSPSSSEALQHPRQGPARDASLGTLGSRSHPGGSPGLKRQDSKSYIHLGLQVYTSWKLDISSSPHPSLAQELETSRKGKMGDPTCPEFPLTSLVLLCKV